MVAPLGSPNSFHSWVWCRSEPHQGRCWKRWCYGGRCSEKKLHKNGWGYVAVWGWESVMNMSFQSWRSLCLLFFEGVVRSWRTSKLLRWRILNVQHDFGVMVIQIWYVTMKCQLMKWLRCFIFRTLPPQKKEDMFYVLPNELKFRNLNHGDFGTKSQIPW